MIDFTYDPGERHLFCKFSGRLDTLVCQGLSEEMQKKLQELKQGKTEKDSTGRTEFISICQM